MPTNINVVSGKGPTRVGELKYGSYLIYNSSFYIKLDKHKLGEHITLLIKKGESALVNLKLGTIRSIPGNTMVTPLQANIDVYELDKVELQEYLK